MTNVNIFIRNKISKKFFKKKSIKYFSKNFEKELKIFKLKLIRDFEIFNVFNENYKFNFNISDLNKFKKFKTIVIIGMGGSILGTQAIFQFLSKKVKKKIYFFNDINTEQINNFKKDEKFNKTLFIVISKSGNTTETLSNFFTLKLDDSNFRKNIIIISEKNNNPLYFIAKKLKFFHVEHKKFIGGRYSVLSEVGIIPAFLMGIDIKKLRKNLTRHLDKKNKAFFKQSSIILAELLSKGKIKNVVFLNYHPKLNQFLFWCQQLIAESLGKNGHGFLPIISNAPKDHHSLLQLYLDGPKDKLFQIFSLEKKSQTKIFTKISNKKINYINNKSLNEIKISQKNALVEAFKKKKIPYREFILKEKNEKTLGELFSYFILETAIIGKIAQINPFDQPAVEQVKKITKEILS